jgi:hypothetical protein
MRIYSHLHQLQNYINNSNNNFAMKHYCVIVKNGRSITFGKNGVYGKKIMHAEEQALFNLSKIAKKRRRIL